MTANQSHHWSPAEAPVVVITGGTGGIGFHSALGIAQTGARVLIVGRNAERGEAARLQLAEQTGNETVELLVGDVSSSASIDALAGELLVRAPRIDVLVNNAGYLGAQPAKSADGLEMHFAVNVFAPRRLTLALLPALKAADRARVLNVTGGNKAGRIDPQNLLAEKGFKGLGTYSHSKSVMEAMSMALAEELKPEGVHVNVVYPGPATTAMTKQVSLDMLPGLMKLVFPIFKLVLREDGGKSAAKAAKSTIWASTTSELDGVAGAYFDSDTKRKKLHPTAYDADVQAAVLSVIERAEAAAPSA
ncbi:MAG: SDR family NAD(P)-dependent oxidoreductase [Myxococcota bacterium]